MIDQRTLIDNINDLFDFIVTNRVISETITKRIEYKVSVEEEFAYSAICLS